MFSDAVHFSVAVALDNIILLLLMLGMIELTAFRKHLFGYALKDLKLKGNVKR